MNNDLTIEVIMSTQDIYTIKRLLPYMPTKLVYYALCQLHTHSELSSTNYLVSDYNSSDAPHRFYELFDLFGKYVYDYPNFNINKVLDYNCNSIIESDRFVKIIQYAIEHKLDELLKYLYVRAPIFHMHFPIHIVNDNWLYMWMTYEFAVSDKMNLCDINLTPMQYMKNQLLHCIAAEDYYYITIRNVDLIDMLIAGNVLIQTIDTSLYLSGPSKTESDYIRIRPIQHEPYITIDSSSLIRTYTVGKELLQFIYKLHNK